MTCERRLRGDGGWRHAGGEPHCIFSRGKRRYRRAENVTVQKSCRRPSPTKSCITAPDSRARAVDPRRRSHSINEAPCNPTRPVTLRTLSSPASSANRVVVVSAFGAKVVTTSALTPSPNTERLERRPVDAEQLAGPLDHRHRLRGHGPMAAPLRLYCWSTVLQSGAHGMVTSPVAKKWPIISVAGSLNPTATCPPSSDSGETLVPAGSGSHVPKAT